MQDFQEFGKFSDITYKRMNFADLKANLLKEIKFFEKAKNFDAADGALLNFERLMCDLLTNQTLCHIRHDINTADKFYENEMEFVNKNSTLLMGVSKRMSKDLLKTPYRKEFTEKYGEILFKQTEADIKMQSFKIVPLLLAENKLTMEYSKLVATRSCEFKGKKCNFYGLLKFMEDPDRKIRKEAMEAWSDMYKGIAPKLDEIYDKLIKLRCKKAKRLGFSNVIDMVYLDRHRFDYNEKDVAVFREQVKNVITPVCDKLAKEQAKRIGVDKLKFYDEKLIFPDGNADPEGTKDELVAKTQQMYREMSPESGEFFDFMVKHQMFDLETKPNKHMGGYCTVLANYGSPFIFSNFNGTAADYQVLTHEAGHCFNMYLSMRHNKLIETVHATSEVCEIHSMSMELFALPWAKNYFGDKADKAVYAHLVESLMTIPYLVSVDEFQHEVFHNPKMTAADRRLVWRNIEKKYMPWRDYDGNAFLEGGGYWMQKQHIFLYPFYYVDYALAQLSAYEFYGKNKADHESAWNDYVNLCKAGGSDTYLNLLKKANLTSPFSKGAVKKAIGYILPDIKI